MSLHPAVSACAALAIAALTCSAQDRNIPFLQMEHNSPPLLYASSSDSVDPNLAPAGTPPEASFEPGVTRSSSMQSPRSQRLIDGKFLLVNGSSVASTFMDYATSRHCVAVHECYEANPLMPKSLTGMISVGILSDTVIAGYSYLLRKRRLRTVWAGPPLANAALHLWGMSAGLKSW